MVENVCSWTFVCDGSVWIILVEIEIIYRIGNMWEMYGYSKTWISMHFSVVEYETLVW